MRCAARVIPAPPSLSLAQLFIKIPFFTRACFTRTGIGEEINLRAQIPLGRQHGWSAGRPTWVG